MYCPRCGKEASGKYCSNCGSALPQKKGKIIEFVPRDDMPEPDEGPTLWDDYDDSMDKTIVLEPVDNMTSDRKRRVRNEESQNVSENMEETAQEEETEETEYAGGSGSKEDGFTQKNPFESDDDEKKGIRALFKIKTPEEADRDYAKFGKDPYDRNGDPEEDEYVEEEDYDEPEDYDKKKKPVSEEQQSRIRKKKINSFWCLVFRFAGFLLLGSVTILLTKEFYAARYGLGNPTELLDESNLSIILYVIIVALFVFTETMFAFRNLSRKKIYVHKRMVKYDNGKGLMGFVLLIILGFISKTAVNTVSPELKTLQGAVLFFKVILGYRYRLILYGVLGCICCGIRIYKGRHC